MKKKCLYCDNIFFKPQNESLMAWKIRHKYCSRKCADKAKIGREHKVEHKEKISMSLKKSYKKGMKVGFRKGHIPWNKDTKGTMVAWNKGIPR